MLPSIPTSEASYGYRYDHASQKLLLNSDPKIMFAREEGRGEAVHFQRQKSNLGINKGYTMGVRRVEPLRTMPEADGFQNKAGKHGTIAE